MHCNCGHKNPVEAAYCAMCGMPEYILFIYTAGQRRRLFKRLLFLTLFMLVLTWASFNLLAFTLTPLYVTWNYFYYNFLKKWRAYTYSRVVLHIYTVMVVVVGFATGPIVRGFILGMFWFL